MGASWTLALTPAPPPDWIDAFGRYTWPGPLALALQPPAIVCVDGTTGIGLRAAHLDGSIAPYPLILAETRAAVDYANAVSDGLAPPSPLRRRGEQAVRRALRSERPAPRPE